MKIDIEHKKAVKKNHEVGCKLDLKKKNQANVDLGPYKIVRKKMGFGRTVDLKLYKTKREIVRKKMEFERRTRKLFPPFVNRIL